MVVMIQSLARLLARRYRPQWVRSLWMRAGIDVLSPPEAIGLPPGTRLLVLAPHPDDESIGCGGLIAKWIAAGRKTEIAILTDGAAGHATDMTPEAVRGLAAARQREAEAAVLHFLGYPDGQLTGSAPEAGAKLAEIISQFKPDIIALPFPADRHPDHTASSKVLLAALSGLPSALLPKTVLCYEVWAPLTANVLVDISGCREKKMNAIAAHASQTAQHDYVGGALALNRYRGESGLCGIKHAEAFWMGNMAQFGRLHRAVQL
jgi:N-acetylglucosamine malate deacetylase 1